MQIQNIDAWWDELERLARTLGQVGPDEVCCEGLTARQCSILRTLAEREGSRLSQIRFRHGNALLDAAALRDLHGRERLVNDDDVDVSEGVSVGVDGSYQSFTDGYGFTFLTGQAGYHFVNRKAPLKWDPFVTFGTGAVFGSEGGSGWTANLGGGAVYWFKPKMGIRFELRFHGMVDEAITTGRIGITFR